MDKPIRWVCQCGRKFSLFSALRRHCTSPEHTPVKAARAWRGAFERHALMPLDIEIAGEADRAHNALISALAALEPTP